MTVVLSNPEDIQELLNKRGTTYSSRPPMHVFHDILFKGLFIPSCAHNDVSFFLPFKTSFLGAEINVSLMEDLASPTEDHNFPNWHPRR